MRCALCVVCCCCISFFCVYLLRFLVVAFVVLVFAVRCPLFVAHCVLCVKC